jgi:chromosome segregation ATPase
MSAESGSTSSGGSKTQQLRDSLTAISGNFDDAVTALDGAKRAADEALEHFMMLGGSADRAQSVIDLIEDLHREASTLDGLTDEITSALDGVDHAITPEENIAELETVTERIKSTKDATTAVVDAADDAINQTQEHLAGSSRADDLGGQIEEARDELDKGRTAMDGLTAEVKAQQDGFRGNS